MDEFLECLLDNRYLDTDIEIAVFYALHAHATNLKREISSDSDLRQEFEDFLDELGVIHQKIFNADDAEITYYSALVTDKNVSNDVVYISTYNETILQTYFKVVHVMGSYHTGEIDECSAIKFKEIVFLPYYWRH